MGAKPSCIFPPGSDDSEEEVSFRLPPFSFWGGGGIGGVRVAHFPPESNALLYLVPGFPPTTSWFPSGRRGFHQSPSPVSCGEPSWWGPLHLVGRRPAGILQEMRTAMMAEKKVRSSPGAGGGIRHATVALSSLSMLAPL